MIGFEREALQRLPLAEAAYRLLDFVTYEEFLQGVFERHRGRSYRKILGFPLLVHLIADALLERQGSGHKSFCKAQELGILDTSLKAVYGKLARVPLTLSQGLLAEGSDRLHEVFPPEVFPPEVCSPANGSALSCAVPASLRELTLMILDGKKIKHVARRLKCLRDVRGQVLAAQLVVAMNLRTGLAVAMNADSDGEAGELPLVAGVLRQVRAASATTSEAGNANVKSNAGPRLWVADRLYCDMTQPPLLNVDGDHFLLRYSAKVRFTPDASRPVRMGVDSKGLTYREEWGWLGRDAVRRQYVRRVTLSRPGEEDVVLVTDLLDADRYPAADLLLVYGQRWGIERVFQRITEVFHLRHLIGSTPAAGVFQAAFCLLLYNVITVLRAYISVAQKREPETISTENLFDDVHRDLVALHEVLTVPEIVALFDERLPGRELRRRLGELLATTWSATWVKARQTKAPPKKHTYYLKGGHDSVYRLQQKAKQSSPVLRQ